MRTPEQIEADRIAEEKLEASRAYSREKTRQSNLRKKARLAAEAAAQDVNTIAPVALAVGS
jgi:hypothetical protein